MAPRSAMTRKPTRGQAKPQAPRQQLERLSPGVYRGAGGQLTNQAGRPLPGSRPPTGGPSFPGGMGQGVGAALRGATQGIGAGMGGGMRAQPRGLEDVARQRADAINRGGMVTMDYNPEREALTNQYLEELRRGDRQLSPMPGDVAQGFLQAPQGSMFQGGQGFGQMMNQGMAGLPFAQGAGKGLGQEINNPNPPMNPQMLQQQYNTARLRRGM